MATRMTLCPECRTIRKAGTFCPICGARVTPPPVEGRPELPPRTEPER